MAAGKPVLARIAGPLAACLRGRVLAACNLPFDRRILARGFARARHPISLGRGFCAMAAASRGGPHLKLQDACRRYGIPFTGGHRALADARAAAEIVKQTWHNGGARGRTPVR